MTADEMLDPARVARLISRWSGLPVTAVPSAGTGNGLFRSGDPLVVRLPRIGRIAGAELRWLPWPPGAGAGTAAGRGDRNRRSLRSLLPNPAVTQRHSEKRAHPKNGWTLFSLSG
ncbi:MAG TPA: hypothetical protein VMB79_02310 [Jatrophihabitans sp.]|nr:hypothetical protein [Jatrophihabitans sp.]